MSQELCYDESANGDGPFHRESDRCGLAVTLPTDTFYRRSMPEDTENQKPDLSFRKSMHLRKHSDFDRVFRHKHSHADRMLVVYIMSNGLSVSRLGLVVSKKVGKAHQRNRWKRLIREVFRLEQHAIPMPLDVVVIPQQGVEPDFDSIRRSLRKLMRKLIAKMSGQPSVISTLKIPTTRH